MTRLGAITFLGGHFFTTAGLAKIIPASKLWKKKFVIQ